MLGLKLPVLFGNKKVISKSAAKCIDCEYFKVLMRCGRQYCGVGHPELFPGAGHICPYFKPGDLRGDLRGGAK